MGQLIAVAFFVLAGAVFFVLTIKSLEGLTPKILTYFPFDLHIPRERRWSPIYFVIIVVLLIIILVLSARGKLEFIPA